LITETGNNWGEVLDAFNSTHYIRWDDPAFCDLREFCKKVLQEPNLQNINLIKNAAQEVIDGINDAVPMTMTNVTGLTRGGLNIHFPHRAELFESTKYVACQFCSTGGGGGQNLTVSGVVTWPGHFLSNFCIAFLDTSHTNVIIPVGIVNVNPTNGVYTITYPLIAPLEAYVEAFDDVNNNGTICSHFNPVRRSTMLISYS